MGSKGKEEARSREQDGASPGKIFIGGLPRDTTMAIFLKHFGKYGEIIDSVIMKDKYTSQPRGFGFITYANPEVVDKVMEDDHVINGKQVEIKRTIPKGSTHSKDFKTKKIFVGGIPSTLAEDEFKDFFAKYGNVVEHQIIRDHETNRSRGFGFIIFDSEEVVDDLLAKGNMMSMAGSQVEIKKAEPKKSMSSNGPPSSYGSEPRGRSFGEDFGGFGGSFSSFGGVGGYGPYRNSGGMDGRFGGYGGYGGIGDFGGGYGRLGLGLGGYGGEPSLGYAGRYGAYGAGYGGGYGGGPFGGFGRGDEGFGAGYGGAGYGGGYDTTALGGGYGTGAGLYGSRGGGGFGGGGGSRYHPYAR